MNTKNPQTTPPRLKRAPTQIAHAKRGVGRLIRQLEAGIEANGVDAKTANALTLAYNAFVGIVQTGDTERRLAELERLLAIRPEPWRPGLLKPSGTAQ